MLEKQNIYMIYYKYSKQVWFDKEMLLCFVMVVCANPKVAI